MAHLTLYGFLLGFCDGRECGVPAPAVKETEDGLPELREEQVHGGEEDQNHDDLDRNCDLQAVERRVAVQVVVLYDELDAGWLEKGRFIDRERNMKERKYKHVVFLSVNLGNLILLLSGVILISFVLIDSELDGLRVVLEAPAQFISECFIEVGRLEKGVRCRILSIDLQRFALCRTVQCFPSNVVLADMELFIGGHGTYGDPYFIKFVRSNPIVKIFFKFQNEPIWRFFCVL